MSMRTWLAVTSLGLVMQAATFAASAADPPLAAGPPAANPKGHYAELNKLPDWGGVWTFNFLPTPGVTRETPQLKGKYLESYQAWQRTAAANHGEVPAMAPTAGPRACPAS
jgi:hypothetical protein